MDVVVQAWSVSKFERHREKINPRPQYQRTAVWNTYKKQLLIDSILRGYDVPKIYMRKDTATGAYDWEVADGQQRLRAIWEFVNGNYSLGEMSNDLPMGNLSNLFYGDLDTDTQDIIHEFQFQVTELRETTELEVRDLFLRLQEGESLNPAEKRNAMVGGIRDFIADLAQEPHAVLPLTRISNNRFAWDNLLAHIACLDLAEGPTDIKAPDLKRFYEDNQDFDPTGPKAKRIRRRLNRMAEIFKNEPPQADIKWGFVDLYQAIQALDDNFVLEGRAPDLEIFYISFEKERRSVEDPADLISGVHDEWDRDLYNYIDAFQRQAGTRTNLEVRRDVYLRRIHRDVPDLNVKDPQRAFDRNQRIVIWMNSGKMCESCARDLPFEEMQADHILPHSKGGSTTIENAQALCGPCNASKGAAFNGG